ncbi:MULTISPECIES: hypothetical protein [unclassified Gilliamella]|uniref:hypothetical protein n=1 Tax=unclassified Gilliamella TaxID=2685620 RepID=UPI00226A21C9|nr:MULTISPECIES: hypothetical protein [unclassified Gilliamella]MCX8583507.1 hypothetical protein [Gilliamella sp. B3372]MCX8594016.1 hypothetical protein [Gilliamella sp. B3367]
MTEKTHFKKAFKSPYLSSADIVDGINLTIAYVKLEADKTKKTKDLFNTAYFVEKEIRKGEPLKPMILNVTNSKQLRKITNSPFIDDWLNVPVHIYVDNQVKFGRDIIEGLRISPSRTTKKELTPDSPSWNNAKAAYKRDGNLDKVLQRMSISAENQELLINECNNEMA